MIPNQFPDSALNGVNIGKIFVLWLCSFLGFARRTVFERGRRAHPALRRPLAEGNEEVAEVCTPSGAEGCRNTNRCSRLGFARRAVFEPSRSVAPERSRVVTERSRGEGCVYVHRCSVSASLDEHFMSGANRCSVSASLDEQFLSGVINMMRHLLNQIENQCLMQRTEKPFSLPS
jgi:hypothetical protein